MTQAPQDTQGKSRRDPQRTRKRILEAATDEFVERGLSGARVDSIARRAGINERMLYYYFGNKEQLYLAVLEQVFADFNAAEHTLKLDELEPLEAVRTLAHFMWDYYATHPALIRLMNIENLHEAQYMRQSPRIRMLVSPLVTILAGVLARGQAAGVIRADVDPARFYVTLSALGYYVLSNRHTLATALDRDMSAPDEAQAYRDLNTELLLNFLRVPAAGQAG